MCQNLHRRIAERTSKIIAGGRRKEVRIDLGPGGVEKAVRGILRVSDESGLHRLVLGPQQEFPMPAMQVAEVEMARRASLNREYHAFIGGSYNISSALICGFE